jgi:FKBP-type peptidyl-prolyl cis-trans isomerase FklB
MGIHPRRGRIVIIKHKTLSMKFILLLTAVLFTVTTTQAQKLDNLMDSVSYAIGLSLSNSFKAQGLEDTNPEIVGNGIKAGLSGEGEWSVSEAEAWLQTAMQKIQEAKNEITKQEGLAFLAENAKRDEVTVTASGLQYEVVKEGTGVKPITTDKVKVHYHGTMIDGTVFDSSVDKGTPSTFGVTQVINGWIEGLQLMKEGAIYKFSVPYNLAYGCRPAPGGRIPLCSSILFEVELIKINP